MNNNSQAQKKTNNIPKIIWSFWECRSSELVQRCIRNWHIYAPDHHIEILNTESLRQELHELPRHYRWMSPVCRSDWARLAILQKHGGIWMDATTILTDRLDWVHSLQTEYEREGVAIYDYGRSYDFRTPYIDSWFIAAVPQSQFMTHWRDSHRDVIEKHWNHGLLYANNIKKQMRRKLYQEQGMKAFFSKDFQNAQLKFDVDILGTNYLTPHLSIQKCMQFDLLQPMLVLIHAVNTGFHFINYYKADSKRIAQGLFHDPWRNPVGASRFIKLTGAHRVEIDRLMNKPTLRIEPESTYEIFLNRNEPIQRDILHEPQFRLVDNFFIEDMGPAPSRNPAMHNKAATALIHMMNEAGQLWDAGTILLSEKLGRHLRHGK